MMKNGFCTKTDGYLLSVGNIKKILDTFLIPSSTKIRYVNRLMIFGRPKSSQLPKSKKNWTIEKAPSFLHV